MAEKNEIIIDEDKECSRCKSPGATQNGLCLDCIEKRKNMVKTEPRLCQYNFNDDEKRDIASELANGVAELKHIENRKKSVTSQLTSEMNAKQSAVDLAAEKLRSGFEMRQIECEVVYAYIDDVVRWIRTDNGEIAHERKMRPDERQMKLEDAEA